MIRGVVLDYVQYLTSVALNRTKAISLQTITQVDNEWQAGSLSGTGLSVFLHICTYIKLFNLFFTTLL